VGWRLLSLLPLPEGWFRFNWRVTGFVGTGGYCVALPLVVVVSLLNQIVARAEVVIRCYHWYLSGTIKSLWDIFFTAAIAAPLLKFLFRGFCCHL